MLRRLLRWALVVVLGVLAGPRALAGPDDPRLERVRRYKALTAEELRGGGARVRVADLLAIVADTSATREVREEAAAAIHADLALVNDPDLSLAGKGNDRPRSRFTLRVLPLVEADDGVTRSLALSICEGLWPGLRAPGGVPGLVARLEGMRDAFLAELAGRTFEDIVRRRIQEKVGEKGLRFDDAHAWLRKDAIEEAFVALAKRLLEIDRSVTVEQARSFFAARPKPEWRTARYGTGGFAGGAPPSGPGAPKIPVPKPPTRDAWWAGAPTQERLEFCWATFVELGLYEVDPARTQEPCSACDGRGTQVRRLGGGFVQEWSCGRCQGARFDLIVKYR